MRVPLDSDDSPDKPSSPAPDPIEIRVDDQSYRARSSPRTSVPYVLTLILAILVPCVAWFVRDRLTAPIPSGRQQDVILAQPDPLVAAPLRESATTREERASHDSDVPLLTPVAPEVPSAVDSQIIEAPLAISLPPADATESSAISTQAYAKVWNALEERSWTRAKQALKSMKDRALSREDLVQIEELMELSHYVQEFWQGYQEGEERLEAGKELSMDDERIVYRGKSGTDLMFRARGRNLRIPRDGMRSSLVLAIADLWFDPSDPAVALAKAAYYTVGDGRNETEAARWRKRAEELGATDEAQRLEAVFLRFPQSPHSR